MLVETSFVPGGFVLVDNTLVGHAVDGGSGFFEGSVGSLFVATGNRKYHLLDGSAQARTLRHIVGAAHDVLPGAFLG